MVEKSHKLVGVLGTGLVGSALTEVLLEQGYEVHIWNRTEEKMVPLKEKGAQVEPSPSAVASSCSTLIVSVMTTDVVVSLCEGSQGVLSASPLPRYILDTTTGDPEQTIALAMRLKQRGIYYLDSPISGSSRQIRGRKGVFMVGGETDAFEQCKSLFHALAEKVFYLGPVGSGSKAKLATNLVLGLNRLAFAEGLAFAQSLGLDLSRFYALIRETPAYSMAMDVKGEKMLKGDFSPDAKAEQHWKDLGIILKYAKQVGMRLPLGQTHYDLLKEIIQTGWGDLDNSVVFKYLQERKGRIE
ncbi:MAG: NAD(P)-dependent oxidoreductase [Spirochaetes bacterium]|nr:NAD(P)-dependent oxidoreductase [Spirochaetota bacterium]